jgi:prepilin-type processing-associated H-X9-DG protein
MRRTGFTIVELLVVVSITVLLMALLLPSLQNSRKQAKTVLCRSNVKQLVLGLITYESEHETFPHAFHKDPNTEPIPELTDYPGDQAYDRKGWWWFNGITDYSKKDSDRTSVLWCPSRQITTPWLKTNVLCGNYGVNLSICKNSVDIPNRREEFVGTPLCSGNIPHPGQTLLIVDSGYSLISWWHATDIPPVLPGKSREDTSYVPGLRINANRYIWPGQEQDAINGRHPNKTVNVGFVDGHVEKRKAENLFVEKTADGYRNKNPLWQPK